MEQNDSKGNEETAQELELKYKELNHQYEELEKDVAQKEEEYRKIRDVVTEFETFYDEAPLGFHTLDSNGLIIQMNQTELDWLGYTREEIVGKKSAGDIIAPESLPVFYKFLSIFRKQGRLDHVEMEYQGKNGSIMTRLVSVISQYNSKGEMTCARVHLWDITDRIKMEKEMLKFNNNYMALKSRMDEKVALLAKLNRELNEMRKQRMEMIEKVSQKMISKLEHLQKMCHSLLNEGEMNDEQHQQAVERVYEEVNALNRITTDYRVKLRISSNGGSLEVSNFNLSGLLLSIVNHFEAPAAAKDVYLYCEVFEKFWLKTDREYLTQIIDKLIANALVISTEGKELNVSLSQEESNYLIILDIRDKNVSRQPQHARLSDIEAMSKPETVKPSEKWNVDVVNGLVTRLGLTLKTINPDDEGNAQAQLIIPIPNQ